MDRPEHVVRDRGVLLEHGTDLRLERAEDGLHLVGGAVLGLDHEDDLAVPAVDALEAVVRVDDVADEVDLLANGHAIGVHRDVAVGDVELLDGEGPDLGLTVVAHHPSSLTGYLSGC